MTYKCVLPLIFVCHVLPSCSDALVFADRSSIEMASVRLNDDVAEPIRINIGMDRQLVTSAPAVGGVEQQPNGTSTARGEAINLFSSFRARVQPAFVTAPENGDDSQTAPGNELMVHTRFASGAAAKTIASTNPGLGAQLMGQGLQIRTYLDLADRSIKELQEPERTRLCTLTRTSFAALTADEKKEAGELTGALSTYNDHLHRALGEICKT